MLLAFFLYICFMVKLKLGALITDASGKLGGQVITKHNSYHVLKNKPAYKKQRSSLQEKTQHTTKSLVLSYAQITDEQRRLWYLQIKEYQKIGLFGNTETLNGFTLFQKLNQGRLQCGLSVLYGPNAISKPSIAQELDVNLNLSEFTIQSSLYNSDTYTAIYATKPLSKGISKPRRYLRLIAVVNNTQLQNGFDIKSLYEAKFGTLTVGQNIYVANKTFSLNSGYSNGILLINQNYSTVVVSVDSMLLPSTVSYWNPDSIDVNAVNQNDTISLWSDVVSGNNGTATGAQRPTLNIVGGTTKEVLFDGSSQWLNVGTPANLNFLPNINNFSCVVKVGSVPPVTGYYLSKASSTSSNRNYGFFESSGASGTSVLLGGTSSFTGVDAAANDLLIWTVNGNNIIVRRNGVEIGNFINNNTGNSDVDINIGGRSNGGFLNNGSISRLAMYNAVLTPTQIAAIEAQYI